MKSFLKTMFAAFAGSLLALFLCGLFLFMLLSSVLLLTSEKPVAVPASAILRIDFSQPVTEQSSNDPLAGIPMLGTAASSRTLGILPVIRAIGRAAEDPAIKFIYLNPGMPDAGMSHLEEIRNALLEFRKSGKPVIAYCDNYSQAGYYLASAADKVYLHRQGNGMLFGISSNIMFFKDLLDKLGVEVQLIRHGRFKAAAEQFVASGISPANREQNQALLESVWNTWLSEIGESRDIRPDYLNGLIDELRIGSARSLAEHGLIDRAFSREEFTRQLCTLFGVDKEKDLRIISLAGYISATEGEDFKIKDKIAVIYAGGEITMDGDELSAARYVPLIARLRSDSTVRGVVLRVNSPGGDAQAADIINEELQRLREVKPLVVSFGDYAASGGYWISAQSDRIFTNNTTITGSIGVFSLYFNYGKGLKEHLGINHATISTNRHSDMGAGMRPLDAAEQSYLSGFIEDVYDRFTGLVARGRDLPQNYVDSIGQGRVWAGADALKIRLADQAGGLEDAVRYAAALAGADRYRTLELPVPKSRIEKLLSVLGDDGETVRIWTDPVAAAQKTYSELRQYNGLKTFARLPYLYRFEY